MGGRALSPRSVSPPHNEPCAPNYCVTAADSSFVAPDKHRGALCHLINVGRVMVRYGDPQAAELDNVPRHYTDLLQEGEEILSGRVLEAKCALRELGGAIRLDTPLRGGHRARRRLADAVAPRPLQRPRGGAPHRGILPDYGSVRGRPCARDRLHQPARQPHGHARHTYAGVRQSHAPASSAQPSHAAASLSGG